MRVMTGCMRRHDQFVGLGGIDVENLRFAMIDPNNGMKMVGHDGYLFDSLIQMLSAVNYSPPSSRT
jgi:hypothetical protein